MVLSMFVYCAFRIDFVYLFVKLLSADLAYSSKNTNFIGFISLCVKFSEKST